VRQLHFDAIGDRSRTDDVGWIALPQGDDILRLRVAYYGNLFRSVSPHIAARSAAAEPQRVLQPGPAELPHCRSHAFVVVLAAAAGFDAENVPDVGAADLALPIAEGGADRLGPGLLDQALGLYRFGRGP